MTKQEVISAVELICSLVPSYTEKKKDNATSVRITYRGDRFLEFPIYKFVLSARTGWPFDYDKELVIKENPWASLGNPQCTVIGFSSITSISLN